MQSVHCTTNRCHVCGFTEIRVDEAVDRELVVLAECPRCEHRWIGPVPPAWDAAGSRHPVRVAPEVASAA